MGRIRTQKKMKMRHYFTLFNFNNLAAIFTADNYHPSAHNGTMKFKEAAAKQIANTKAIQIPCAMPLQEARPPPYHPPLHPPSL